MKSIRSESHKVLAAVAKLESIRF